MRGLLLALALAVPAVGGARAQEGCPGPADLGRGIVLRYSDDAWTEYRLGEAPGEIRVIARQQDGRVNEIELAFGVYPIWLELAESQPETIVERIEFSYVAQPGEMIPAPPVPGRSVEYTKREQGPRGLTEWKVTRTYGPVLRTQLGGCEMPAMEVEETSARGSIVQVDKGLYLLEFGVALYWWRSLNGQITRDRSVTRFEALP